ncbi:CHAT domain-containing protein [Vibrio sp. 99-70-13A1]|uniref:CHAT domain-containing protein n=1 Tax=Vibrio sp. 99-70-13A1 TaxID=2607601 RepID=UPI001493CF43|nr:CHAT domain-containing protein [Vibrio sp. 99-70-13A1]NOH97515.1 CHAT domain-containing protein [Vibrio sp. 99-70-13A1]
MLSWFRALLGGLLYVSLTITSVHAQWLDDLYDGNILSAEQAIIAGADVNAYDPTFETFPIFVALYSERIDSIEMLHHHGANLEQEDEYGRTAMFAALEKGDLLAAQMLQKLGASITPRESNGVTAFHYGVLSGRADIVEWVMSEGVDVNQAANDNWNVIDSIFMLEMEEVDPQIGELIHRAGLSSKTRSEEGYSLLDWAISYEHDDLALKLLVQGYTPYEVIEGTSLVDWAVDSSPVVANAILQLLIDDASRKQPYHDSNYMRYQQLRYSARLNNIDVFNDQFDPLLIDEVDAFGNSLLQIATSYQSKEILGILINNGADLNIESEQLDSSINLAFYGSQSFAKFFTEQCIANDRSDEYIHLGRNAIAFNFPNIFYELLPLIKPEELRELDLDMFSYEEDMLAIWVESALVHKNAQQSINLLRQYLPNLEQDNLFIEALKKTDVSTLNSLEHNEYLARLLAMDVDSLSERNQDSYQQNISFLTENIDQKLSVEEINRLAENLLYSGHYSTVIDLLKVHQPQDPTYWLLSLFESEPEEDKQHLYDEIANQLVTSGAQLITEDIDDSSPLILGFGHVSDLIWEGWLSQVDLAKLTENDSASLIRTAIEKSNTAIAKLIEQKKLVYQPSWNELLWRAIDKKQYPLAFSLWSQGAYSESWDSFGIPLITKLYLSSNDIAFERWVAASPVAIEVLAFAPDHQEKSLLSYVLKNNDSDSYQILVDNGLQMSVEVVGEIAQYSSANMVLEHLPKLSKSEQQFLLQKTITANNFELVNALLEHGVNPHQRNESRRNSFDLAIDQANSQIMALLDSYYQVPDAKSTSGELFDDPHVRYWSWLNNLGDYQTLISSVERNVLSGNPHPFARHIWLTVHDNQRVLPSSFDDVDEGLVNAMGAGFKAEFLATEGKWTEAITEYEKVTLTEQDLWLVNRISGHYIDNGVLEKAWDSLEQGIKISPNFWQLNWRYFGSDWVNNEAFRTRLKTLISDIRLEGTIAVDMGERILADRAIDDVNLREMKHKWLDKTYDSRLATSLSYFYSGRDFQERSLSLLQQAVSSYPFYSNVSKMHENLATLGRHEQLAASALLRARWYSQLLDTWADKQQRYTASAYRQSGDKGRAYDIFSSIENPDSVLLALNRAALYMTDKHYAKVVRTLEPFLTSGELGEYEWRIYIQSLSYIGETALAIDAFKSALSFISYPEARLYLEGIKQYNKANMPKQASELLELALKSHPTNVSLNQEYAKQLIKEHQADKAVELLNKVSDVYPEDKSLLNALFNALVAQDTELSAKRHFFERAMQQAWNDTLLDLVADKSSDASKVWLALLESDPTNFNATLQMLEIEALKDDFDAALNWLNKAALIINSASEKNDWVWNKTWLVNRQNKRFKLPKEDLQKHLKDWESYKDNFGYLVTYHRNAAEIYFAMDDFANAGKHIKLYSELYPDSTNVYTILVQNYHNYLPNSSVYGYGYRMVKRDPYSGGKVNTFARNALYWGQGTDAIALKFLNDARSRGVKVSKKLEQKALSDLGDHLAGFLSYRFDRGISSSLRYVGWFDSMREEALSGEGNIVRQRDYNGLAEVEIVLPNGEVYLQRDDPKIGKPVYMSKGASYLEIAYDERGNLTLIKSANGNSVELIYDLNDNISLMLTPEVEMSFQYNANNKPIEIATKGLGSLIVEYDSAGDITRTYSEEGHKLALRITQSFQAMMSLVQSTQTAQREYRLPEINRQDDQIEKLEFDYRNAFYSDAPESTQAIFNSGLALAIHLSENLTHNSSYASELLEISYETFENYQADDKWQESVAQFVRFWFETQSKTRPLGLFEEELATVQSMRVWLNRHSDNSAIKAISDSISHIAFREIQEQSWRQNSILSNTGYWYRTSLPDIEGLELDASEVTSMLALENGDVLVGTQNGLILKRDNFWSWFNYDGVSRKLIRSGDKPDSAMRMNVENIVQSNSGFIYIATQGGLFVSDSEDKVVRWNGIEDDLTSELIAHVENDDNQIWVAIESQIIQLDESKSSASTALELDFTIDEFKRLDDEHWLVLSGENLHLVAESGQSILITAGVEFYVWRTDESTLWWWDGKVLQSREYYAGELDSVNIIADTSTLPMSQRVIGFTELNVPELGNSPVVLTDKGLGVWHKQRFHLIELPYEELRGGLSVGPIAAASNSAGDWTLLTQEGVYDFALSRSSRFDSLGKTTDLRYIEEFGMTFAATGREIYAFFEEEESIEPIRFSGVNARVLRQTSSGDLITHDGRTVVKIEVGSSDTIELFDATSEHENRKIEDIFVDTDDSIWVVAGADLFHWNEGELEHFNYYIDPKRFPSRSNMLVKVFRDLQGDLYVVASDEGHLDHQGVYLDGGLLKLGEFGFERVKTSEKPNWFTLGYTPISNDKAIVSTGRSFLLDNKGKWRSFETAGDVSYQELHDRTQMLFLGRQGVKMGSDDAWLFPSAAGVVMYQQSGWLYPDRLNQLLIEDQSFGQYGARVVHAVSVDGQGRVFVATDLGVTLYNAGGLASLLSDHDMGTQVFLASNTDIQNEISSVFLDNIPKDSEQGKLISKYHSVEDEIELLEVELESQTDRENSVMTEISKIENPKNKTAKQLQKELKRKERSRQRLLANLERDHTALYQMLRVDPREISALNDKLNSEQLLVQFIPTPDKLLTQVVSKEGANVFEIAVKQSELNRHISLVNYGLRQQALTLNVEVENAPFEQVRGFIKSGPTGSKEEVMQSLSWLYDKLLRPIEGLLDDKQEIYITPAGQLNYVPFAALIRSNEPSLEYAIERYPIGILPSLYHFNLIADGEESLNDMALFVSDPDGSLPGARHEVQAIESIYSDESIVLEGEEASIDELESYAFDSQVIHFATHGVLDSQDPADSFLLMANNQRLGVIDISMMDLQETDLVVLSACESGIGIKGLEYASMARAFAHAKVPTVVASYWQVNDAATSELMRIFYNELKTPNQNKFVALAKAQRAMIAKQGDLADPAAWSSFAVFGKP